ncbi:histidine kinase [Caloramator sp. E03]|uniref:sensor histidine kinase n=1 Tax=Caloramator sp. E03 TaxID=2576307 RepID=UPI001110A9CE|nr:PocR ligand-binding domain-containing protein [Caloramator sp. E03]QCX34504.1 histidine kinase [Caloramator sp. E03]
MNEELKYKISEIIDINFLQNIQDKFAKMLGLAAITVNSNGSPIDKASNFIGYCNLIRKSKKGYQRCSLCDANGCFQSMNAKSPVIYRCHAGLTDVAAPIIVDDTYIGGMLCGQVILEEQKNDNIVDFKKLSQEIEIPEEDLRREFKKAPIVSYDKLRDASDFLYIFANYIAKIGMVNITQSKLLKETKEKIRLENLLRDTQIKSLQSQINPHFLFNTLNTIARMALIEGAPKTEDLIYNLSDLLRYNLKNSGNMVEIETEINNIRKYINIQAIRYGNRISYEINIDPEILDSKIPVMTLQPIVENAIIHGLEEKKEGGKLIISGKLMFKKYILLEICDNGLGIPEEKLISLLNSSQEYNKIGLGIHNVDGRIKYYFGNEYGLRIESTVGKGTKVQIRVPYIK